MTKKHKNKLKKTDMVKAKKTFHGIKFNIWYML